MTDPTPERRRWTVELAEGFVLFRNSYGGAYSTSYEPDLEDILATLNEAEDLRERVRVLEAQALEMRSALREVAESSIDDHWLRDRCARALAGAEPPDAGEMLGGILSEQASRKWAGAETEAGG